MNIAICDDKVSDIKLIYEETIKCLNSLEIIYDIKTGKNKSDIIKLIENNDIDVLLLDINLADTSGFEIAGKYYDKVSYIIFISADNDMVFEAVKYKPYRFIRKTHLDELYEAFYSIKEGRKLKSKNLLTIQKGKKEDITIKCDDIIYIESYNGKLYIHTVVGIYEERAAMKDIIADLNNYFVRVHRGYIVNMKRVRMIKSKYVGVTEGGKLVQIPIKRNFSHELKEKFIDKLDQD